MTICPCKDCTRRSSTCHARCTDYEQWKKDVDEARRGNQLSNLRPYGYGGWIKTPQGYWRNTKTDRRR